MQIPIKVDYGVRALVDLAQHANQGLVRAREIAQRTAIPEPFLAQVLHALRKHGLVQSQRGPKGGHALATPPSEIRLSTVMTSLGETPAPLACLAETSVCALVPSCAQRSVWQTVSDAVFRILDATTIEDLVNQTPDGAL